MTNHRNCHHESTLIGEGSAFLASGKTQIPRAQEEGAGDDNSKVAGAWQLRVCHYNSQYSLRTDAETPGNLKKLGDERNEAARPHELVTAGLPPKISA